MRIRNVDLTYDISDNMRCFRMFLVYVFFKKVLISLNVFLAILSLGSLSGWNLDSYMYEGEFN